MAFVEAITSAILQPLIEKLASASFLKFAREKEKEKEIDSEIKKWKLRLLEIRAVLSDAEEKQITNQAVKIWLNNLRDLAYDAQDVLEEFETEAWYQTYSYRRRKSKLGKNLVPTCFAAVIGKVGWSKLEDITSRLQEIVAQKDLLDLSKCSFSRFDERLPTTSLMVKKSHVYGREKDKEALVELLIRGGEAANGSPFSVISIIGYGGVGKTTLAQLVYNDDSVEFDYKAWVCVSDEFDVLRITKAILDCDSSAVGCDLNLLQVQLKVKLSGKKFLIVLDDVWSENYEEWTALCSPFASGARGSRVIITTRNEGVSLLTGSIYAHALKELSDDDCLLLFAQHALDASNFDDYPDFKETGEEIVTRCRGLPLAAKTLGGLLRGKRNSKEWKAVLNSKLWDLPEENSGILSALRLSYHHLPSHLKQCFAYCAIFPKDYEFDKNELVLLWMAEGFLQQTKEKKQMKDIGKEYFDDLLSRSFFQKSSANNVRYVMHDLISELAQFVSREVCFHLGDKLEDSQSYAKVRYSSFTRHRYDISQRFEVFYEMKSLRTFLPLPIFSPPYNYLTRKVLHDLVPNLKRLAVLSLAGYCLLELPSSICALKHLRYLNLSYTEIEVLPESLCEVFRLQTLRLRGCKKLIKLPRGIDNLINLQYLDISGTDGLQEMPSQIGNLTNLHTLPKFIIGKGLGIRELMKLSHLQGQLNITGLHNVVDVRDTELAILKEKRGLRELSLEWIHNVNGFQSEARELQLLNLLEPHQNLQKLSIMSYGGTTFPSWLGDHSFSNMVCLQLCECHKTTSLPSLGQLPVLRDLSIKGMERVTTVGVEFLGVGSSVKAFPSLESLIIEDMLNWKQWSWSNGLNQEEAGEFPNLRELTIIHCPMLVGMLPSCLPSVKKLSICNCPQLVALPESLPYLCELIVEGCNVAILNHMPVMPSLTTLKVVSITGLVSLCRDFLQALVALEDLEIENCNDLMYLWQDGTDLRELASMKHLEIKKFEQFVSLVDLEIPGDLEQLPSGLQCLGSLRNLKIDHCPKLVSLPEGLPYSLQRLEISQCDLLKSLPDGMVIMVNGCKSSQCLEELLISWCPSLKSIPVGLFPITLKSLAISWCTNLKNLHGGIVYNGDGRRELSYLEHLTIEGLPRLLFPAFELPWSLKTLEIGYCKMQSLESLCDLSHLTELEISGCSMLESFPEMGLTTPNLISLSIWKCENLRSLPNHMDCLVSLQELSVNHCYSLVSFSKGGLPPNLIEFEIRYCENITESMSDWGLHTLIFLKRLVIECTSPCTNMVSFPDDEGQLLPTSLTTLYILTLKGLKSISKGLKCLMSLEILMISDCPKLCFFPKEGFPATLGSLHIEFCPLLKKQCSRKNGRYWPMIALIPDVFIQGVRIL